jgi:hypothetical protein
LRGLDHVPEYHKLHLPVAERISQQEQVTIPHQLLLAGPKGVRAIVDAVSKIGEHGAELHNWWTSQLEQPLPA